MTSHPSFPNLPQPTPLQREAQTIRDAKLRRQTIDQATPTPEVPRNVMEALVAEEIDAQLQQLSPREQKAFQRSQIMGYALNRLPGLYVTSEKGWQRQWSQGKTKLQCQVKIAVRQGIAAVQRDPLREVTVLSPHPPDGAEIALQQLQRMLMRAELNWNNLVGTIQMLLVTGEMEFPDQMRHVAPISNSQIPPTVDDVFDWDSHPLHQRGF